MHKFNGVTLKQESILSARQYFADLAMACLEDAKKGGVLASDYPIEKYAQDCHKDRDESLAGKNDHTFTFLQRAYYIQTGECVALLP